MLQKPGHKTPHSKSQIAEVMGMAALADVTEVAAIITAAEDIMAMAITGVAIMAATTAVILAPYYGGYYYNDPYYYNNGYYYDDDGYYYDDGTGFYINLGI